MRVPLLFSVAARIGPRAGARRLTPPTAGVNLALWRAGRRLKPLRWKLHSIPTAFPQIPYGWADFEAMRLERCLYVDKTRFLHELEKVRYAFLIRPRRFGKSCWVSLFENYYDRNREDRFERLFADTDIGRAAAAVAQRPHVGADPVLALSRGAGLHAGQLVGTEDRHERFHQLLLAALRVHDRQPRHAPHSRLSVS